jgi:hypothetical protein
VQGEGKPFFEKTYPESGITSDGDVLLPFVQHYPPHAKYSHAFEWMVKKVPDRWVFFRVGFYPKQNDTRAEWHTGVWSKVCGDESMGAEKRL